METSVVDYLNLAFSWLLVLLSIWGYATVSRKTGRRMAYWLFFGVGWMLLGFSNIFNLAGVSTSAWYMVTLHAAGYTFIVISIFALILHIVDNDSM